MMTYQGRLSISGLVAVGIAWAVSGLSCAEGGETASNATSGAGGNHGGQGGKDGGQGGQAGAAGTDAGPEAAAGQAGAAGGKDASADAWEASADATGAGDGSAPEGSSCPAPECAAGQTDTEPCGACSSGSRTRSCKAGCTWGTWSPCAGEGSFPSDPVSSAPVCPPYPKAAVFFAPHPDDETLGMGGAIAEHVASGRPVFLEMLTHGDASGVLGALNNGTTCSWHSGAHSYALTAAEFGEARIREFKHAATLLGVKGVYVSDLGDGQLQNKKPQIAQRMQWWISQVGTGLSLKGIATTSTQDHADHRAQWSTLLGTGWGDIRGYAYSSGTAEGTGSNATGVGLGSWCAPKAAAFQAYKQWKPSAGRYAIGYHSVSAMFDQLATECIEYKVVP